MQEAVFSLVSLVSYHVFFFSWTPWPSPSLWQPPSTNAQHHRFLSIRRSKKPSFVILSSSFTRELPSRQIFGGYYGFTSLLKKALKHIDTELKWHQTLSGGFSSYMAKPLQSNTASCFINVYKGYYSQCTMWDVVPKRLCYYIMILHTHACTPSVRKTTSQQPVSTYFTSI